MLLQDLLRRVIKAHKTTYSSFAVDVIINRMQSWYFKSILIEKSDGPIMVFIVSNLNKAIKCLIF
jgi:hypothetical protein